MARSDPVVPLLESDLKLAAKQGVRIIMNNRPDGEAMGQPLSADLAKIAEELGMTFLHLPVDPRAVTKQNVEYFTKARDELERPLLIFLLLRCPLDKPLENG